MNKELSERTESFIGKVNPNVKNSLVPTPPKPGELIVCTKCGKVMQPEDFSTDPIIRKKEFKWQMHWNCQQELKKECDVSCGEDSRISEADMIKLKSKRENVEKELKKSKRSNADKKKEQMKAKRLKR